MSADVYQAAAEEIDKLRRDNHRLRDLVKAADLVHIRLRDVVRTALERVESTGDEADRRWAVAMRQAWLS